MKFTHSAGNIQSAIIKLLGGDNALLVTPVDSVGNESGSGINRTSVNCYIGKPSNGNFVTARTSNTTITMSSLPTGLSAITDADIESVRQINSDGQVVAIYNRRTTVMTVANNVLTVSGATFAATDTLVIYTNIPVPASSAAGGAGGGSIVYTNASGDFTADITNGTTNITVTGLPFVLEAKHVAAGQIKKIAVTTNIVSTLNPTSISVAGGVITLGGITNFVTGDIVVVTLIGPDKAYDKSLDIQKVVVQNNYVTDVETLVDETNILGYKASGDAGGNTTTIVDADGAFSAANIAVGYKAYQTADAQNADIVSVDSATNITTTTLSGAATWSSKAYSLPQVKRYEISMGNYHNLTIHYRLRCLTFCNAYLKIYGTLDAAATADDDTAWVNMSADFLGDPNGISIPTSLTEIREDVITQPLRTPMLKYMVKLVVESNSASPNTNSFKVFIKKSM